MRSEWETALERPSVMAGDCPKRASVKTDQVNPVDKIGVQNRGDLSNRYIWVPQVIHSCTWTC